MESLKALLGLLLWFSVAAGFLALVIWQLKLSQTKGIVWSRNGYVGREENPTLFAACVVFYWFALIWSAGMMVMALFTVIPQM